MCYLFLSKIPENQDRSNTMVSLLKLLRYASSHPGKPARAAAARVDILHLVVCAQMHASPPHPNFQER